MLFPFFSRPKLKQVVLSDPADPAAQRAGQWLAALLTGLPELLLGYVYDLRSQKLLAYYTRRDDYRPARFAEHYQRALQTVRQGQPEGGRFDLTVLLDRELHCLWPLPARHWEGFVASALEDANPGLVREVLRRTEI